MAFPAGHADLQHKSKGETARNVVTSLSLWRKYHLKIATTFATIMSLTATRFVVEDRRPGIPLRVDFPKIAPAMTLHSVGFLPGCTGGVFPLPFTEVKPQSGAAAGRK